MEIHEGTSTVKEAKLYLLKGNFSEFTMKKDESIAEMFNRLNDIVTGKIQRPYFIPLP